MKKLTLLVVCLLLTGCTKRELEDRKFPSLLVAKSAHIEQVQEEEQKENSRYIDYGHVKAVILSKEVAKAPESLKEVLLFLEKNPAFARNIMIFAGNEAVLKETDQNDEWGDYLEDIYKNKPRDSTLQETILNDMLNYLHNQEAAIEIPYLVIKDKKIVPSGKLVLKQK